MVGTARAPGSREGDETIRAVVIYESMYGNTHVVADHIAEGLRSRFDVDVVPVGRATAELSLTATSWSVAARPMSTACPASARGRLR